MGALRVPGSLHAALKDSEDIILRDGVFVPARKALGGLKKLISGKVHSGRAPPMGAQSAEDLSLNQTAVL